MHVRHLQHVGKNWELGIGYLPYCKIIPVGNNYTEHVDFKEMQDLKILERENADNTAFKGTVKNKRYAESVSGFGHQRAKALSFQNVATKNGIWTKQQQTMVKIMFVCISKRWINAFCVGNDNFKKVS